MASMSTSVLLDDSQETDPPGPGEPARPVPPLPVVLAAVLLALHAAATVVAAFAAGGGDLFFGHTLARLPQAGFLVSDPAFASARFRWEMNADEAASTWLIWVFAVDVTLAVLLLRGRRAARTFAVVIASLAVLAAVPLTLLSSVVAVPLFAVALLVLLHLRPTRRYLTDATRWRRGPGRAVAPSGWLLVGAALSLFAAGGLVWIVAPEQQRLAPGVTTVRNFDGVAATLVDPARLVETDAVRVADAVRRAVPVTAGQRFQVTRTDGDQAAVLEQTVVKDGRADWTGAETVDDHGGRLLSSTSSTYAVDRESLAAVSPANSDWSVDPHQGLAVAWPPGAERRDHVGWVADIQQGTPLRFDGTDRRVVGRPFFTSPSPSTVLTLFRYRSAVAPTPIVDRQVLARLPGSMSRSSVSALGKAVLAEADRARLDQLLGPGAEPVPLDYTFELAATYWVEPTSGVLVGAELHQVRRMVPRTGAAGTPVGLVVEDVTWTMLSRPAGAQAWSARDRIRFDGVLAPALCAGLALLLSGVWAGAVIRRRRA